MTGRLDNPSLTKGAHDGAEYSVPQEAGLLLSQGVLGNNLIAKHLPLDIKDYADNIKFVGSASPSLPINWRFAESISALKGLEASMLCALMKRKYGAAPQEILINTDHAQLFIMSAMLWNLDPQGDNLTPMDTVHPDGKKKFTKYFPDREGKVSSVTALGGAATNIYRTKDDRFFHLHGSLNLAPTLAAIGLLGEGEESAAGSVTSEMVAAAVATYDADDLQDRIANQARQAGTICHSTDEYLNSEHGRANAHVGLWESRRHGFSEQKACWWPSSPDTSPKRPLAGLKVVDLTRIIAAPAATRGLAELGASVMRVTCSEIPDMSMLHPDLNHGKWNCNLNLRHESDRAALKELIKDADVVVQAYRPGVLEKYGFGEADIIELCKDRERGIIYAKENCYGWHGPWQGRSGWQQISDANTGVSLEFGRAMGFDEPVTPIFPNSDYCTGVIGVCAILGALIERSEKGGSYTVDLALNYYSQWLVRSVGTYPAAVWSELHQRSGHKFRHDESMASTLPAVIGGLAKHSPHLFNPKHFTTYEVKNMGSKTMRIVAPVLRFPHGEVEPGFAVGTRGNGVDAAKWPEDLSVEVVV